jgi:hypothetical protein
MILNKNIMHNRKKFKRLCIMISQVKPWLRLTPVHLSKWHIQDYFDKLCFRINRSQFKNSIFHKTICRMVEEKPIYQNLLK